MPYTANYPDTVGEVLRRQKKYNPDALRAMKAFRRSKPWRGDFQEQKAKFQALHDALCEVYGMTTELRFVNIGGGDSGSSHFIPTQNRINLCGRFSVITYLHEFGHARGWDERYACIWSINLFKRIFPKSFERCDFQGHMVVNNNRQN